ncbi:MAG: molybdenum cofactor guanylyltransferase [Candidatus Hydrogenedentota bacterium]
MPPTPEDEAPLRGLILVGGRSSRMGRDKSQIAYHGLPEWKRVQELLSRHIVEVFISVSAKQVDAFDDAPQIVDRWDKIGPMNGIASALAEYPDSAWFVLACDMPALTDNEIERLLQARVVDADATIYCDAEGKREPLCCIYEPSVASRLNVAIDKGDYSLNRCLQKCKTTELIVSDGNVLKNVNTPEESESFGAIDAN